MSFEQTRQQLIELARENGGVLTALAVEANRDLCEDPAATSAAAHAIAGSTNAFGEPRESEGWFPYERIRLTDLR